MKEVGGGKAHLGIVTSGTHLSIPIDKKGFPKEDVLGFYGKEENWPGRNMYPISKLFIQYASFELAKLALGPDGSSVFSYSHYSRPLTEIR